MGYNEYMKINLGNKPLIYPQPVLIIATYNDDGTANAMNAAWGGVCDYSKVSIIIDRNHHTTKNLLSKKAFTVSIADVEHLKESDYFGLVSGKDILDKLFLIFYNFFNLFVFLCTVLCMNHSITPPLRSKNELYGSYLKI